MSGIIPLLKHLILSLSSLSSHSISFHLIYHIHSIHYFFDLDIASSTKHIHSSPFRHTTFYFPTTFSKSHHISKCFPRTSSSLSFPLVSPLLHPQLLKKLPWRLVQTGKQTSATPTSELLVRESFSPFAYLADLKTS